jgi:TolA-binding protein
VFAYRKLWSSTLAIVLAVAAVAVRLAWTDPWVPHRRGLELFHSGSYQAAEPLFSKSKALAPSSAAAYYSDYYLCLSAFRALQWDEAIARLEQFIRTYPDGELIPEAHFRTAEALQGLGLIDDAVARFLQILDQFSTTQWAGFAADRLAAIAADSAASSNSEPGATGSQAIAPEASMTHHERP